MLCRRVKFGDEEMGILSLRFAEKELRTPHCVLTWLILSFGPLEWQMWAFIGPGKLSAPLSVSLSRLELRNV